MKAVLLAAGSGTRLRPFSLTTPKVMIPFLGKPLLFYHIDEFLEAGITEIAVVCAAESIGLIEKATKKAYPKLSISFAVQKEQLGPSHAIYCAKDFFKDDDFVMFKYADSMHSEALVERTLQTHAHQKQSVVCLRKVEDPSRYGIARLEGAQVVELVEKPKENPPSDLAVVGIGILDAGAFLSAIESDDLSVQTKEVIPQQYVLRSNGSLAYWEYSGGRVDLGKPRDIILAHRLIVGRFGGGIQGSVHPSAMVDARSWIGPDARIGAHCTISGSSVEGVVEEGCKISDSVVMQASVVGSNSTIQGSVFAEGCKIGEGFSVNSAKASVFVRNGYEPAPIPVGCFVGSKTSIGPHLHSMPGKVVYPGRTITSPISRDRLLRAIIFDADNTLYNTGEVAHDADIAAMHAFSASSTITPEDLFDTWQEIVHKLVDDPDPRKRHRMYSYGLLAQSRELKNPQDAFKHFLNKLLNTLRPMPGIMQLLPTLSGFKLGIISEDTTDMISYKLMKLGLRSYFSVIVTADVIGHMKPDVRYFRAVTQALGVSAPECLFVGDNYKKDLALASEEGALVCEYGGNTGKADYTITTFDELAEIINEL